MSWVPKIDSEFAGYRIVALIGHGGMSVVYRAEHLSLGRQVALKLLAPHLTEDASFRERFTRESRLAASLEHPNIIPIYEAGDENDVFFIAMRFVDGSDLKSILKRDGPLDLARAVSICTQIAAALNVAHSRDLVHRDIKPANILIASGMGPEESDHVYVSDFGVAKQTSDAAPLTRTGLFVGTADYAAPEQIEGKPLDGRADIYALGCVLYQTLTGEMPYDRDSEVAMMYAHLLEPPPVATEKRTDLPAAVDEIIAKAMAKAPEDRYASARDFAGAARALLPGAVQPPTLATVGEPREQSGQTVLAPTPPAPRSDATSLATSPGAASAREAAAVAGAPPVPPESDGRPSTEEVDGSARRRFTSSRWAPLAAAAVAAAALSGGAVFILTNDDDSGSPGTEQTIQPPTALGLQSLLPSPLRDDCTEQSAPAQGAAEGVVCEPGQNSVANSPDRWEVSTFNSAPAIKQVYDGIKSDQGIQPDSGRCDGSSWGGEGEWFHGPDKPGGRYLCYFDGDAVVLVWTHDRLGQGTHKDTLGIAREATGDHSQLFGWWRFWRHRIGRA
jgi:serine/threonine protein kinase